MEKCEGVRKWPSSGFSGNVTLFYFLFGFQ